MICEVTKTLMEADIFYFDKKAPQNYDICTALPKIMNIRTAMFNIEQSMNSISGIVDDVAN